MDEETVKLLIDEESQDAIEQEGDVGRGISYSMVNDNENTVFMQIITFAFSLYLILFH